MNVNVSHHQTRARRWRPVLVGLFGISAAAVVFATPAAADDGQYLADLKQPGMVHPAMSNQDLLVEGRYVCFLVGKQGVTSGQAKQWVVDDLSMRGLPSDMATGGTLVHFALHDLCPHAPNSDGI